MASWGCGLEPLEKLESSILLELKALQKGACKMGELLALSQHLVLQVMPGLKTLLKVTLKAYPKLFAMFINIQQCNPTWIVGSTSTTS